MTSVCDKSWMKKDKSSHQYFRGCKDFVEFAWLNKPDEYGNKIYCPCIRCANQIFRKKDEVLDHIRRLGISRNYTCWTKHGESEEINVIPNNGDDMHGMLRDAFTTHNLAVDSRVEDEPNLDEYDSSNCSPEQPNKDAQSFFKLLKEAETPLFPGSTKSTKLSFIVRLLHTKCINGWSNKSVDMLLETLRDSFPDDINMPKNYYEAKKLLRDLGMQCIKIDACPKDCMLYWKDEDLSKNECDICGESRWKPETCQSDESGTSTLKKQKKKAAKILRYFPLKPRLQRLFMCSKTSKDMRWHNEGRTKDGIMRHPGDTEVWKNLDRRYPWFAADPRNVRLGLASDGFNPFGSMTTTHSTWYGFGLFFSSLFEWPLSPSRQYSC